MTEAFIYNNPDVIYMSMNKIASTTINKTLGFNWGESKSGLFGIPEDARIYDTTRNLKYYKNKHPNHFTFTFVRNPYDRIVSYYKWNCRVGEKKNPVLESFDVFVKNIHPNFAIETDFKMQSIVINDECDFIGRFERLESDFKKLMNMFNIEFDGFKMWRNKTNVMHYSKYYTSVSYDIVTEKFKDDIEKFGYKFEEK